jgi:phosphonate metabolism protein PhnN/1,5-bisphosphokinase (PRPP-forming)
VASRGTGGFLVVLIGEEGRGKEMLVAIAQRRFGADASLVFPPRVSTRSSSADIGDELVSRRAFREMAEAGAFVVHWETGGHAYGLGAEALGALERGLTVVVIAGREAAADFAKVWPDVRVIEVRSGPDTVLSARRAGGCSVLSVNHPSDLATAVRSFHELISTMRLERLADAAPSRPVRGRELGRLMSPPASRREPSRVPILRFVSAPGRIPVGTSDS